MSEKEKEAQVSENETKGENFFFKHKCTTVCQKAGATEILAHYILLIFQSIAEKL